MKINKEQKLGQYNLGGGSHYCGNPPMVCSLQFTDQRDNISLVHHTPFTDKMLHLAMVTWSPKLNDLAEEICFV